MTYNTILLCFEVLPLRVQKYATTDNMSFHIKIEVYTNNRDKVIDKRSDNHIAPTCYTNVIICNLSIDSVFPIISSPL